jgi:hypothetical protein
VKPHVAALHLDEPVPELLRWCHKVGVVMMKLEGKRGVKIDKQSLVAHLKFRGGVKATPAQRERYERIQQEWDAERAERDKHYQQKPLYTPEQLARFKELQQEGA